MKALLFAALGVAVSLGTNPTHAACPADRDVALMAARYSNLQPVPNPPGDLTMKDALCGRDKFVEFLGQQYGRVVGYKAGLTSAATQKRFNHNQPIRGVLLERMLVKEGVDVPAQFGTRPVFEADLILEVRDSGIHQAKSPLDALNHLSAIYPFIELADLIVEDPAKLTGPALQLVNVGARMGVLGKPVSVRATPELVNALATMTVKVMDQDSKELDSGKGSAVLDQPLNAVLWLAQDIAASGGRLKKGDLLSLGSFSRLMPPKAGLQIKVVYEGLPGNPAVGVRFR